MSVTLLEAWRQFRAERAVSLCPTTLTSDYQQVERWIERCPVLDLSEGRKAIIWTLEQDPPQSAARVARYLKTLYRWATSEGVDLIGTNPVASVKLPKKRQDDGEVVVIPADEMPFVLAALERANKRLPRWELCANAMLQLGCRTGELFAIQVADVQAGRLEIHQNYTVTHGLKHSTKTNKRRSVPLNSLVAEILDELRPHAVDGFIFPWKRTAFQKFFMLHMQKLHEAGLISRRYRCYDLRHTAISRWLEAGVSIQQCAQWAGNSAEMIWRHYAGCSAECAIPVL